MITVYLISVFRASTIKVRCNFDITRYRRVGARNNLLSGCARTGGCIGCGSCGRSFGEFYRECVCGSLQNSLQMSFQQAFFGRVKLFLRLLADGIQRFAARSV